MAKSPNLLPTEEITLSVNSQTAWYLDRLVERGLYGNNRAQAASIVIFDHCKALIAQGEIGRAPSIAAKSIDAPKGGGA